MNQNQEQEVAWIAAMVALEDERGSLLPHGAQGGAVARARRTQTTTSAQPAPGARGASVARPSAARRARDRVRGAFQATEMGDDQAA